MVSEESSVPCYIRPMPWYRHLLWPFAILYGLGVFVRNRMFDFGVLNSTEFDTPIICIGNLETGGTGKSPLVHYVVKTLLKDGVKVAVLSRGYGRASSGFKEVQSSCLATEVGDESLQTKLRFPSAKVVVCENRVAGVQKLFDSDSRPDVIVMDDGFQHRWIKPSLNILVTPNSQPFWRNYLLPVGNLRESRSEARRAQVLVVSNSKKELDYKEFDGQIFNSKTTEGALVQIAGFQMIEPPKNVVLFSGIANPSRFEVSVQKNHNVLHHQTFADHHIYKRADLQKLKENYDSFGAAADAVLTTEKDAARLLNSPLINELGQIPVYYLPISVVLLGEEKLEFDKMILAYGKHA